MMFCCLSGDGEDSLADGEGSVDVDRRCWIGQALVPKQPGERWDRSRPGEAGGGGGGLGEGEGIAGEGSGGAEAEKAGL